MKEVSKNINNLTRGKKSLLLFVGLAVVGVILMCFVGKDDAGESKSASVEDLDPAEYAEKVEKRVEELCNRIDGVSSTYAVVTLKGGYRAIYALDMQSGSSSSKNQTVVIGSGSGEHGLLVGYENPEIAGIGIVCSGGDDYNIKKNIIAVVSSAFDISSNKIFVAGS